MILIPVFLLLFACWMLWGWMVGESKNIKWLRHWCAPIFVVTVILISAGAGAVVARRLTEAKVRTDVTKLLQTIEHKLTAGQGQDVMLEIRATDRSDDPDRDAFDLLDHIAVMHDNLSPSAQDIAEVDSQTVVR